MLPSASGVRPATLLLPYSVRSVSRARRELKGALAAKGLPRDFVDDALLVLSELLSNAIKHGRALADSEGVRVSWLLEDDKSLHLEVSGGGAGTRPHVDEVPLWATRGRGLAIVGELAGDWGIVEDRDEITVWARLRGPSERP